MLEDDSLQDDLVYLAHPVLKCEPVDLVCMIYQSDLIVEFLVLVLVSLVSVSVIWMSSALPDVFRTVPMGSPILRHLICFSGSPFGLRPRVL